MIEKSEVLNILQDIELNLDNRNCERALKDVNIYIKNIELTTNEKIKNLFSMYEEYLQLYGKNHIKTMMIRKKLDKEFCKTFSRKD